MLWNLKTFLQVARLPLVFCLLRPSYSLTRGYYTKNLLVSGTLKLRRQVTMSRKRSSKASSSLSAAPDAGTDSTALENILTKARVIPQTKGRWHLHEAISHLATVEPKFTELFLKYDLPAVYLGSQQVEAAMPTHNWEDPPFTVLSQIIVYQQLSGASAGSVWRKFLACFDLTDGKDLSPQLVKRCIVSESIEDGKKKILINGKPSGLSAAKAKYIQALTDAFLDESMLKNMDWDEASDEVLFEKLIAVKGLGVWSVHMFMMFALHRPNVLPLGDLGIRRGLCSFFGYPKGHLENKQNLKKMSDVCSTWSPYSSFACFYLWKYSVEPASDRQETKKAADDEARESSDDEEKPKKKRKVKK